mgnify:CR=1 FL=1
MSITEDKYQKSDYEIRLDLEKEEARKRILLICRNSYAKQMENGLLGRRAYHSLNYLTTERLNSGYSIDEWPYISNKLFHFQPVSSYVINFDKTIYTA